MKLIERFLKYVSFDTQSCETTGTNPSTPKQFALGEYLRDELTAMGLQDVELTDKCYLYATLPANTGENVPTVGFIAHMDTSPDASGENVKPSIVHYEGGDILLNAEKQIVMSPSDFPEMENYIGEDLIVTDGTTLLGADDKAGIAEIVSGIAYLQSHPEIKHGKIRVGFTPDEEIGCGADFFDVEKFGCDWAYTFDGGEVGELEFENFNAASGKVDFIGRNVHPGYAKDKMINALRMAITFADLLPRQEVPECTEGYEGFFHLMDIHGSVEEAQVRYIIRDHDRQKFEDRKTLFLETAKKVAEMYGCDRVVPEVKDSYYNMLEMLTGNMYVVDIAKEAMLQCGVTPKVRPIRGGTDGARLSFMGLPCPNIFAGGLNFHGRFEFVPVLAMEKAMMTMVNIAKIVAEKN
ncbi:MAG: peptidase T [Bacteroidaceae bacterium]|nr:peptidase T [Bacteroidaceae bacterium]